jgi:hypothetical protein
MKATTGSVATTLLLRLNLATRARSSLVAPFQVQHEKGVNTRNGGSKSWRAWCEGRKGEKKMKNDKSHVIERGGGGGRVIFCHPFID